MKFFLGVCIIIICTLIGKIKAQKYKNVYLYFSSIHSFCKNYLSNLSFSKKNLDCFLSNTYISSDFNSTLNTFIKNEEVFIPEYLTQKEKDDVITFFSGLGVKNSQAEEILVNSFIKTFLECEAEKNKLYKKYYSTYLKIGFSVGFMLFLLVI